MIEISNLSKNYKIGSDVVKAVDNVNLIVQDGAFISILGHSGSGKTTLLSLIGGLTKPDSGSAIIDSVNLWSISDEELSAFRNRKINFIFQFPSLIPTLTVMENVQLPTVFSRNKDPHVSEYAHNLLELVGLKDKKKAYPSQLSGGQQRRASIARAFINRPNIILADEPTGDLDEETEVEIMNLFLEINQKEQTSFIIVTHSSELAAKTKVQYRMAQGILNLVN